jgi:transposase
VEDNFRQSKDDDLVSLMPLRHWTDSKIRCHIFSCIVALAYLRRIELQLQRAKVKMSAAEAMDEMHRLHSCLIWEKGQRNAERMLEEPTKKQADILKAFGFKVANGVLQNAAR